MLAEQQRGGAAHRVKVQRLRHGYHPFPFKDVWLVAVPDAVHVGLFAAAQTRVEARRRLFEGDRPDVLGQVAADLGKQRFAVKLRLGAERADLSERVHAGVRPARACDLHALVKKAAQQPFELSLNGVFAVALPLPAVVTAAVVAEREPEIAHLSRPSFPLSS